MQAESLILNKNKSFSLHSSQVCMTRGNDARWLDTKYIVMVSAHTIGSEDKLNDTCLLTICHALWPFPQLTQATLSFLQSLVGWSPAHSPHLSRLPQAAWVCPHPWHLKHCFISRLLL